MNKIVLSPQREGFYGAYYPTESDGTAIIAMMGDDAQDHLAVSGAKWLHRQGCSVLAMAPAPHNYSHHNYPLERFRAAIDWLHGQGIRRIGILGASTTGMLALIAAAQYPEITFTLALSASDFVMEGFYQEKGVERPGDGESTVSVNGKPLPYLPFAYRHPQYAEALKAEAKTGGNMVASREMFDLSESLHPIREEEKIKIENIRGRVVVIGAKDDCLWDTCRYMRRMQQRLDERPHDAKWTFLSYEHGTHFVFPQSMLKIALPVGSGLLVRLAFREARKHPAECKATRVDIDKKITQALRDWKNARCKRDA